MPRSRLARRVFLLIAGLSAFSVLAMTAAATIAIRGSNAELGLFTLKQSAVAFAELAPTQASEAQDFCKRATIVSRFRMTLIGTDGVVWGDSRSEASAMDNHLDRPEVADAMLGGTSGTTRTSNTLGLAMTYAAAPIIRNGVVAGVLRLALDAPDLSDPLRPFLGFSVAVAAFLVALAALAGSRISASLARPALTLMTAARQWSDGNLEAQARGIADPEFRALAQTMNVMATTLADRIRDAEKRQAELDAVLAAMGEGVIAVDADLIVRTANPKSIELLGGEASTIGISLLRASGNPELERYASCAKENKPEQAQIIVFGEQARTLMVSAEPLGLPDGSTGVVLALSDISPLKRLERVRRDFVANVSHELRTPITLIKGFAETLDDGRTSPQDRARFTSIIRRHADRLASIVDDLLTLAKLESGGSGGESRMEELEALPASRVLGNAVDSVRLTLEARNVNVNSSCPTGLMVNANEGLLEQALINLLDNAAKYGPKDATVELEARIDEDPSFIRFSVRDRGAGIPEKDLPKIFERFYRVDRARSRELGGTGLGLAIVRHIALAHGGDVSARIRKAGGSEFTIRIPAIKPSQESGPDRVQDASPEGDSPAANS